MSKKDKLVKRCRVSINGHKNGVWMDTGGREDTGRQESKQVRQAGKGGRQADRQASE